MLRFITKKSVGARGERRLDYDINITLNKEIRKGKEQKTSLRIGFRNHCADRIKDTEVALAYDDEQMIIYVIPKRTVPDDAKANAKFYTLCMSPSAGCHVKTTSPELVDFVKVHNLSGFNNIELDTRTGWFMIKPLVKDTVKFVK